MSASVMKLSTPSKAPSTPTAQTTPSTPQTGTWQHPRFAEIARRQNATTFSDRNVRSVVYNVGSLFLCWIGENFIQSKLPAIVDLTSGLQPYPQYIYNLLRLLFLANITIAILPLLRPKDTLADIPLTPAQRSLLGLPASNTPPTPGSTYITPPRYARSPAPRNSGSNSSSPLSGSPLSGRNSPINGTPGKEGRGSPFNPNASPLLHKTFNNQRRDSYGSPSPLGRVGSGEPGTPSPSGAGKASVGLNSKWLYEKGRRTSQGGSGGRLFNKLD
ncbi:hypothetical protein VE03_03061 [Pseudogymnoascus sp. 23342-1-I1]|nr:hypothetical protein VE03_03061 [Pseudogymnoascus sp. 23342-1-I1]